MLTTAAAACKEVATYKPITAAQQGSAIPASQNTKETSSFLHAVHWMRAEPWAWTVIAV